MKRMFLTVCAAALLFAACNNESKTDAGTTDSTGKKTDEAWVPVDSATQMQKMTEYATPGEMHKMMASWSGNWDSEITMWNYEGAQPMVTKGKTVNSMILGDKYQVNKHSADMMGMLFEGIGTLAYDNAAKKFISTWIDNMGTGIMTLTGDWDAATKTLTSSGTTPDVCRPGKTCNIRETFKVVDNNTQLMEMYSPDPKTGKEYKMMAIKLTRKK